MKTLVIKHVVSLFVLMLSTTSALAVRDFEPGLPVKAPVTSYAEMPSRELTNREREISKQSISRISQKRSNEKSTFQVEIESNALSKAKTALAFKLPAFDREKSFVKSDPAKMIRQVGAVRVMTKDIQAKSASAGWQAVSGGYVWRISVQDAESAGMRSQLEIPAALQNAHLRVMGADNEVVGQSVFSSLHDGRVWTGYSDGATQTIEVFSSFDPGSTQPKLIETGHFYESLTRSPVLRDKQQSGSCNEDVLCGSGNAAVDAATANQKKAVTWLNFNVGTGLFICTGTLINSGSFPKPFVMTANHCIGAAATAASVTTFWFREATACKSDVIDTAKQKQVAGGAKLSFTNFHVDGTLLEMNQTPPAGVVYSAWSAAPLTTGDTVIGLSHPRGDPIKFATGVLFDDRRPSTFPQDMYALQWTKGQSEGGSSGSGLLRLNGSSLVFYGTLFGQVFSDAPATCSKPNTNAYSVYGRFEIFHPQIANILDGKALPADDAGNDIGTAKAIAINASTNGQIGYAGDLDVYRIDVTSPGLLSFNVEGGADLVGAILDSKGEGLDSNDDAQANALDPGLSYTVQPGTYYINIAHFDAAGTAAYNLTTRLDAVTANYSDIWFNPQESGWGINISHQANTLFAALYTYERDGTPVWLTMSAGVLQADGSYQGELFKVTGPAFNASPWPSSTVRSAQVGTMKIAFSSEANGTLTYSYDGANVTKEIQRFQYGKSSTRCNFTIFDRSYSVNFQDMWWTPAEPGWGLTIAQQDTTIFSAIYNYDATGKPLWLVASSVTLAVTGNEASFTGDLFSVKGPAFNASPWTLTTPTKVGTLKFTPDARSFAKGTLVYTVNGVTVTKKIERFNFASPASECSRVAN